MFSEWLKNGGGGQTVNSSQRRRQSYLRRKKIGAVLIEFAFSIPVFLLLVYYIHDLPRMKLLQRKMQFASNIMAATIQNIARKKAGTSNPKITMRDMYNAKVLASLAIFPGLTQYRNDSNNYSTGYAIEYYVHHILGTGNDQGYTTHCYYFWERKPGDFSSGIGNTTSGRSESVVKCSSSSISSSDIYPLLRIKNGESKLIVECSFYISSDNRYMKEKLGFLFFVPQYGKGGKVSNNYFPGVTIITPISGAFDSTTAPTEDPAE